jgi:hypothetical protein
MQFSKEQVIQTLIAASAGKITAERLKNAEPREYSYYDQQIYLQTGTQRLAYFGRNTSDVPPGRSNYLGSKSEMPSNQAMIVTHLGIDVLPGGDQTALGAAAVSADWLDDYLALINTPSTTIFQVGQKIVYTKDGPLRRFATDRQVQISGMASDSTTAGANQRALVQSAVVLGRQYAITPKVILPGDAFTFATDFHVPPVLKAGAIMEARLFGWIADL